MVRAADPRESASLPHTLLTPVGEKLGEYWPIQIPRSKRILYKSSLPEGRYQYTIKTGRIRVCTQWRGRDSPRAPFPMQGNAYIGLSCQVLVTSPVEEVESCE